MGVRGGSCSANLEYHVIQGHQGALVHGRGRRGTTAPLVQPKQGVRHGRKLRGVARQGQQRAKYDVKLGRVLARSHCGDDGLRIYLAQVGQGVSSTRYPLVSEVAQELKCAWSGGSCWERRQQGLSCGWHGTHVGHRGRHQLVKDRAGGGAEGLQEGRSRGGVGILVCGLGQGCAQQEAGRGHAVLRQRGGVTLRHPGQYQTRKLSGFHVAGLVKHHDL